MTDTQLAAYVREVCGVDDNDLASIRVQYDRMVVLDLEGVYDVFVKVNKDNYVTAVESSAFIAERDKLFWLKVDSGTGELYKYARVKYCPKGLMTDGGYNYKLVDGVVVYAPQYEQPEGHNEMSAQEEFFIATRNYAEGELVSVQNRMYEVIATIPNGGKIIIGQNVVETTLEDYIIKRTEG